MQSNFYSLMYDAGSDGDSLTEQAGPTFTDQLQSLQYANERLRTIVAELILKNETLRSKLSHHGLSEALQASFYNLDSLK